jgi:TRAP transporter TAXI family solute receptor
LIKSVALAAALVLPFATAQAQEVKLPRQLIMATDSEGGVAHTMGSGFVSVLTKHVGTRATILPIGDPQKWIDMARSEEVDIAMTSLTNLSWTYWGTGAAAGKPNKIINVFAVGAPSAWGFVVPADAPIKTADDLKKWLPGKKLTHQWINPTVDHLNLAFLANLGFKGLEDAKLQAVPVSSYNVFVSLWNEHRVDVAGMPVGIPLVQQMNTARPLKFVPFYDDPAARARLEAHEPSYYVSRRAPNVLGVNEEMPLLTYDYAFVGRSNLDNAVVRHILQTLYDHQEELGAIHGTIKNWLPADKLWATANISFPYHPGAVEFYKAKGLWTPAIDKKQNELVAKSKG